MIDAPTSRPASVPTGRCSHAENGPHHRRRLHPGKPAGPGLADGPTQRHRRPTRRRSPDRDQPVRRRHHSAADEPRECHGHDAPQFRDL